jgi:hypothetical protein
MPEYAIDRRTSLLPTGRRSMLAFTIGALAVLITSAGVEVMGKA